VGFFCWGLVYSKINTVPEVLVQPVTRYVNHYVERPTVEVVETFVEKRIIKQVPVVEFIEVEKEVLAPLRQFESEEELIKWLHIDKTDELPYIKDLFECENFSRTLMKHALEDGYYMSFQVLKNYSRPKTKEFVEGPHAVNSTIIGNYIYFIDPQNDEFWIAYLMEQEFSKS
jgi:hypothetical protein